MRKFAACSFEVKLRMFQAFCTSFPVDRRKEGGGGSNVFDVAM